MSFCTAFTKQRKPCRGYALNNNSRCHKHKDQSRELWKKNFLFHYQLNYNWYCTKQYKNHIIDAVEREKPVFTEEDFATNRSRIYFDLYILLVEYDKLDVELIYKRLPHLLIYIWRQHTYIFIMTEHSRQAVSMLMKKGGPRMISTIIDWLNTKIIRLRDNPPGSMESVVNSFFLSLTQIPSIKDLVFYDIEKLCINEKTDSLIKSSFESHFLTGFRTIRKQVKQEMKMTKAPIKEQLVAEVFHPMYLQKYFDMGYELDYILDGIW